MRLAEPTAEILDAIAALGVGVVECGAGDGYWLKALTDHGIDCIGYDPNPRSPSVRLGDHRDAARHSDRALMIIFYPSTLRDLDDWIGEYAGNWVLLCGADPPRPWSSLNLWELRADFRTTGQKNASSFRIYGRR